MERTAGRGAAGNGGALAWKPADGGGVGEEIRGLPSLPGACAGWRRERRRRRFQRGPQRGVGRSGAPTASGFAGARVSGFRELESGRDNAGVRMEKRGGRHSVRVLIRTRWRRGTWRGAR